MRRPFLAAVLLATLAGRAQAGTPEEEFAAARGEFDAIVKETETYVRVPHGPSLTKLVHDFVSRDPKLIGRVEAAAWRDARHGLKFDRHQLAVENTIRFLHDLPQRRDPGLIEYGERTGFDVIAGAIVYRRSHGGSHGGPGLKMVDAPLEKWLGDTPPRPAPAPVAAELLAVDVPAPSRGGPFDRSWSDSTRIDFGMALGEACSKDDAAFERLLARSMAQPASAHLLVALGWSGRPEAVELLVHTIVGFLDAGWEKSPYAWMPSPVDTAVTALRHADETAWTRLLAGLTDAQRCRLPGATTAEDVVRSRLAALDAAGTPESRLESAKELFDTVRTLSAVPGGADAQRLLHAMLGAVEGSDEALRAAALAAADQLLGAAVGKVIESGYRDSDVERRDAGLCLGALVGTEATLRQLVADVDTGRIAFRDDEVLQSREPRLVFVNGPAKSNVPEDLAEAPQVPVLVTASWTHDGLHLRFVNESTYDLTVDPVALRYGRAERVTVTTSRKGLPPVTQDRFRIVLGVMSGHCTISPRLLVPLARGAVYECDIAVRPALRGGPQLDLSIAWGFRVEAPLAGPVVRFHWTRVL